MAAIAKSVGLNFGLLSCAFAVHGALEPKDKNVTVCTGVDDKEHDPIRIAQKRVCAECGEVPFAQVQKAREVPDGLVLLTAEDLEEVKQDASPFKTKLDVTPHPSAQVLAGTASGDKAYHLVPTPGGETTYHVLAGLVAAHSELAFLTRFTPRSNMGVFQLTVQGGALLMIERIQGDRIKAAPAIPGEAPEAMLAMAEQVLALPGIVSDFDLAQYRDSATDKLREIVATRSAVAELVASVEGVSAPAAAVDAMSALQAMLDQAAAPKAPAKKAAPRKRAAKKKVDA